MTLRLIVLIADYIPSRSAWFGRDSIVQRYKMIVELGGDITSIHYSVKIALRSTNAMPTTQVLVVSLLSTMRIAL